MLEGRRPEGQVVVGGEKASGAGSCWGEGGQEVRGTDFFGGGGDGALDSCGSIRGRGFQVGGEW